MQEKQTTLSLLNVSNALESLLSIDKKLVHSILQSKNSQLHHKQQSQSKQIGSELVVLKQCIRFTQSIRTENLHHEMNLISFRTFLFLFLYVIKERSSRMSNDNDLNRLIIMITASHNPKSNNGLKIELVSKNLSITRQIKNFIQTLINSANNDLLKLTIEQQLSHINLSIKNSENQKINFNSGLIVYLAKDTRLTSIDIKNTITNLIQQINRIFSPFGKAISTVYLGELTTPTTFSLADQIILSPEIEKNLLQNIVTSDQMIEAHYTKIFNNFNFCLTKILSQSKDKERLINQSKNILLDFGNGIGALEFMRFGSARLKDSFGKYGPLNDFKFKIRDPDFANVNQKCGAKYLDKYYEIVKKAYRNSINGNQQMDKILGCEDLFLFISQQNQKQQNFKVEKFYDQIYHFDGDADRILCQFKDDLLDGDRMNSLFIVFIKDLIEKVKEKISKIQKAWTTKNSKNQQIMEKINNISKELDRVQIVAITNPTYNSGLQCFLKANLPDVRFVVESVGILNLSKKANSLCNQSTDNKIRICSFFEPNGHGNLFYGKEMLQLIEDIANVFGDIQNSQKEQGDQFNEISLEISLLKSFYKMQFNCKRGYAISDFLCLQIIQLYYKNYKISKCFSESIAEKVSNQNFCFYEKQFLLISKISLSSSKLLPQYGIQTFKNSKIQPNPLIEPQSLIDFVENLTKGQAQKNKINTTVFIRTSQTQPVLRLTLKGDQQVCYFYQKQIKNFFEKTFCKPQDQV